MRLVLDYAKQEKNGEYAYRRRAPKDVPDIIGKLEFKRVLGPTRAEAL